jgi:MSHA biogenesis protein MshM
VYYSHFGLTQAPFKITPNTEFFFSGGNRGPVLEALIYAITHGEGIIKVTGEVGSGKTMLCHMLQTRLPPHIETVYIANPSVSPQEILHAIAFELQLGLGRDAPRLEVMQRLQEYLLNRHAEGRRVIVFVEESQSMPLPTLEEMRLLSNLETKSDKLLQIVLFGQPELDVNLGLPNIRQLRERITQSFRLDPLAPGEIREYLMFRMRAAGYRGPDLFSPSVVKHISRASQGLTRRINLIADKALLAAFSENTHTVRAKHIDAAVRDSEFSRQAAPRVDRRYWWGASLIAAGVALGVSIFAVVQYSMLETPTATPPVQTKVDPPAAPQQPEPLAAPAVEPTAAAPKLALEPAPAPAAAPPAPPTAPAASTEPGIKLAVTPVITPAPPRASAPEKAALPRGVDPLEARLVATREWLSSETQGTYSIQLMGAEDATQLKHHLNVLSKSIEMNKVFVYRTMAKQKPSLTVLYGSFGDRAEAQQALKELPAALKAYRPILRTVQGIRGEMRQHQTNEQSGSTNS